MFSDPVLLTASPNALGAGNIHVTHQVSAAVSASCRKSIRACHAPAGGPGVQVCQYGTYERVAIEKIYGAKVKGALIPNLVRKLLFDTEIHVTCTVR